MNKLGGGGLILAAIVMVIAGLILQLEIIDFMGGVLMVAGGILAIVGVVRMITGRSEV